MRRLIAALVLGLLPIVALAEDADLFALDSRLAGRQWDAVGRLNIGDRGFCTGALIAPHLVLTAAHCLFDRQTRARVDQAMIEFRPGWRNGDAAAYRKVRRAVVHPRFVYSGQIATETVRYDLALLELERAVRNTTIRPFDTAPQPPRDDEVGVVSYARDRAEAPSLQRRCAVLGRQDGMLVMSCDVDFGASGSPVFSFEGDQPRIVSVVSAMAEVDGRKVALGAGLGAPLDDLRAALAAGAGFNQAPPPRASRVIVNKPGRDIGAKFIKP